MIKEIEFEWEIVYVNADENGAEIIWQDRKHRISKDEVISMNGIDTSYVLMDTEKVGVETVVTKSLEEAKKLLGLV